MYHYILDSCPLIICLKGSSCKLLIQSVFMLQYTTVQYTLWSRSSRLPQLQPKCISGWSRAFCCPSVCPGCFCRTTWARGLGGSLRCLSTSQGLSCSTDIPQITQRRRRWVVWCCLHGISHPLEAPLSLCWQHPLEQVLNLQAAEIRQGETQPHWLTVFF